MPLHRLTLRLLVLMLCALQAACATPGGAARRSEDLAVATRASLAHFETSPGLQAALLALAQAKALVIFPHVVSASFIVGASEADGLLFVRDRDTGHWVGPVFCSLSQGSIGLQAGASLAEVLMIVNSAGALRSISKGRLRLGMDASVAFGKGGGGGAAIIADIDSYALSKGLFAGVALDGSALRIRPDLNAAWYGKDVTLDDILARRDAPSPDAGRLALAVEALSP
jgi:lipid-binding SYLF domain-containing protein